MSIFIGAPIKSGSGTKSDVARCGNNCLNYTASNGARLLARCLRGSACHRTLECNRGHTCGALAGDGVSLHYITNPGLAPVRSNRTVLATVAQSIEHRQPGAVNRSGTSAPAAFPPLLPTRGDGRATNPLRRCPSESAIFGVGLVGYQGRSAARYDLALADPLLVGDWRTSASSNRGSPHSASLRN
jgi:hypothetical protein